MSFEHLSKDPTFTTGLALLNNMDDKKFLRLVDRMITSFEPHRTSLFTKHEVESIEKSLKLNGDQCQCLLNCLNRLLKQVISDVTKPLVLKNVLSNLFSLDLKKVELFCKCWITNAEQVVSRLQQNVTHSYKLMDVNWALNVSSNVGVQISDPKPRCLIELKVEDNQGGCPHDKHKIKDIFLDLNEDELKKLYNTLEAIKVKLDTLPML